MSWANEGLACPGLWCHCSGEAGAPGRHAVDRPLPKEESVPVGGQRQRQREGNDAFSQGPWAHKPKPHEARQWEHKLPPEEDSMPVGGGGNARGRVKDALSQAPWAHKSKHHEARQWEHRLLLRRRVCQSGGGGNTRGRERMLSLRGPGPTSLNLMRPDSENTGCYPRRIACQSGGGGNARGREKDALSQAPWAHKSKPHEARQWEPWTPHLESSVTQACLLLKPVQVCDQTSWVLEMEMMGFVSEGPLAWSLQFPWVIERSLLPVTKVFLISLALSLEMGPSKSWKRISAIKCFHLEDTWACNSTQNASYLQSIKWKLTQERIPHPASPGRCEKYKQDKLWPYVHFPFLT